MRHTCNIDEHVSLGKCYAIPCSIHILGQSNKNRGSRVQENVGRGGGGFICVSPHQIKNGAILSAVCEAAREASGIKSCDIFISDQT